MEDAGPSLFGADPAPAAYRVLARKYRPTTFDDLIGQEPMVRTLSNAFDLDRIHQAYMLTGVRGVGKTTTARILARAFNYELPAQGRSTNPTIHMPELGVHCQAIIESRHVDVIEMDAASHTGIDDVREIIENARYQPGHGAHQGLYHRRSAHALQAGLQRPAEDARRAARACEIHLRHDRDRKGSGDRALALPAIRSAPRRRAACSPNICAAICDKEAVAIEAEALRLIARAAEGSVRDALSLLDQAIAHGAAHSASGAIAADDLRSMLGARRQSRVIDLFEALMAGDWPKPSRISKTCMTAAPIRRRSWPNSRNSPISSTRLKLVPRRRKLPR